MFDLFLGVFILNSIVECHILTVLWLSEFKANDNVNVVNFHYCYCLPMDKGVAFKADFFYSFTDSPAPTPLSNAAVSPATPAGSTPVTPSPAYKPTTKIKDEEKIIAEFKVRSCVFLYLCCRYASSYSLC